MRCGWDARPRRPYDPPWAMPKYWPKHMRELAREGWEADGVILRFVEDTTDEGGRATFAVVRWLDPEGGAHETKAGASFGSGDPRGRGDVMRAMFDLEERPWWKLGGAVVLSEPESAAEAVESLRAMTEGFSLRGMARGVRDSFGPGPDWGRKVEATVTALEPGSAGGTRVRVRTADGSIDAVVGPELTPDPRQVGDVVDLGLDPATGALVRAPTGPAPGAAERRAQLAREPGLLRKVWDSPWSPF